MEQVFVFIYKKGSKIKAISLCEAKKMDESLIKDGWKHTQTLDACLWIQYLHNNWDNIRKEKCLFKSSS